MISCTHSLFYRPCKTIMIGKLREEERKGREDGRERAGEDMGKDRQGWEKKEDM